MKTHNTMAAVAYSDDTEFRLERVEIDSPRADEVLVEIKGVGVCHTDLVFRSGNIPYPFPAVFGHEGSGVVQAVGDDVDKVVVGDHVLVTFRSCGDCNRCNQDDAAYCHNMPLLNAIGSREDGSSALSNEDGRVASNFFGQSSFAAHSITYQRNLVKVDKHLPIELLGPLGCSVQTGAGSVMRSLDAHQGSTIVIAGGGSVGLCAVMGAVIQQCSTIIVLEPMASRRELAKELGATHCIDPGAVENSAKAILDITSFGVDNALDTTALASVQKVLFDSLGPKGTLGLVGIGAEDFALPCTVNDLFAGGKTIKAIVEGDSDPDSFLPELVEHFEAGRLPIERLITKYKLSEINQAIADQHSGACIKAVLIPSALTD